MDDDKTYRLLVRRWLEQDGRFEIVGEAGNGWEAIQAALQCQPDLVLLDLNMPGLVGFEALPQIMEVAPWAKVIALSGSDDPRTPLIARRLGADQFLSKGLDGPSVVAKLAQIVQQFVPMAGGARASLRLDSELEAGTATTQLSVLFVSDGSIDPKIVQALLAPLVAPRFDLVVAPGLREGADSLLGVIPDLVLVGVELPGLAGSDTILDILARAEGAPVVVIAPRVDAAVASMVLKLGCDDCLDMQWLSGQVIRRSLLYALERRRGFGSRTAFRQQAEEVQRLKRLAELENYFLNTAAHQLRTPLTPIQVQLDFLKTALGAAPPAAQSNALAILKRNVARMAWVVEELVDAAHLQAGKLQISMAPLELGETLTQAVYEQQALATAKEISIKVRAQPAIWVKGNRTRLVQVFNKLISNALKFTPPRGDVEVRAASDDGIAWAEVRDSGIGMSPAQLARLFNPFLQVHDDASIGGAGLGLHVSRGLVQLHGGKLEAASEGPQKGSVFTVTMDAISPP